MRLDEKLEQYAREDYYPFHMPGHKRRLMGLKEDNPFSIDITEIDGFDNLHHAEDIIAQAQKRACALYGAKRTFYCVNGSTAALLSAVSAATTRNGTLLMARNCHKAVYHGAYLRGLKTVYVYPQAETSYGLNGGILPEDVEEQLKKYPEIEAVLITSPTYDGVVSDVAQIAQIVHQYGKPLIVDEAHGAHFSLASWVPVSALSCGADVVIHSLHKTLPSLTQTALLHVNSDRVSESLISRFMGIYQTSSPSYVFMASMDSCVGLLERDRKALFEEYRKNLFSCREELSKAEHIQLVPESIKGRSGIYDYDPGKIILSVGKCDSINGSKLAEILLEKYHLQMEMTAENYVLALTSIGDSKEGLERLARAVLEIDENLSAGVNTDALKNSVDSCLDTGNIVENATRQDTRVLSCSNNSYKENRQQAVYRISEAMELPVDLRKLEKSVGEISTEFVYLYPPGIPLLVPGERITETLIKDIFRFMKQGLDIQGLSDYNSEYIAVVAVHR
jgi:arginine decarboxylase